MFTNSGIIGSRKRNVACRTFLLNYVFPILIITSIAGRVGGSEGLTTGKNDDICPCLPMDKCPRIYGQSAVDIRELGFLKPCHKFGTVRCCGVTIRIEHEKDDERNQGKPIIPLKESYDKNMKGNLFGATKPLNNKQLKWAESSVNATTTVAPAEKPVGAGESWSTTTGSNPLMKFRRRKVNVAGKPMVLAKPSTSTGGGATLESQSAIKLNSSSSDSYLPSSQTREIPSRPRLPQMRRKLKTKVTDAHEETETLNSMTSGGTGKVNPVFSRIRKPTLKLGIKVDSDLPATVSLLEPKESEPETVHDLESINSTKTSPTQSEGKRVLDLEINVEQRKLLKTPLSSQPFDAEKPYAKNQGSEITKPSANSPLSRISGIRNNTAGSNKIRPILLNNKLGSYVNITQVTPNSNDAQLKSNATEEQSHGVEVSPGVVKLRRPGRPNLRRRPLSHSQPKSSPQNPHEISHGGIITSPESVPVSPQAPETSAIKIETPPRYRNRIRINRVSTTTSATPKKTEVEYPEGDFVYSTIQLPTVEYPTPPIVHTLSKQESDGTLYPDEKEETSRPNWTQTKEPDSDHSYKAHDYSTEEPPMNFMHQPSTSLPSRTVEPEIISPNTDHYSWTEYNIKNPSPAYSQQEPHPLTHSIVKASKPQFDDYVHSRQSENADGSLYEKEEGVSDMHQQIPRRGSPIRVSTAYTKVRNKQETTPSQTEASVATPSRRFKVPTNFHLKSPSAETFNPAPIRNSYALEEDVGSDGENYDMILDKESREQLKGAAMQYQNLPLNTDYYHSQFSESIPYSPEKNLSKEDQNSPYHSYAFGEDREMEEETRIHIKFVEKTNPPPSLTSSPSPVDNVNKPEYRRIPVQKPGYDTQRISTGSVTLPSKVNSPVRMTIIKSQKVEQIPEENDFNKGEATFSLGTSNTPSKRIKARFPFSTTSTTTPPPTTEYTSQETPKFSFPPFSSRGSAGKTTTTTTIPPAVKITEIAQEKHNSTYRTRTRLAARPLSTSTSRPAYYPDGENSNDEKPTEPFTFYQISATEIPATSTSPSTTPESVNSYNELSSRNNLLGHSPSSFKPVYSQPSRFPVPKTFNFSNILSKGQNSEPKFKFPTEQANEQPFRTPVVDMKNNVIPHSNHFSTIHSLENGVSSFQIIKNGNNGKVEFASKVKEVYPPHSSSNTESNEDKPKENHHNLLANLHLESGFNNLGNSNPISNSNTQHLANIPKMQTQVNINNGVFSSPPLATHSIPSPISEITSTTPLKQNLSSETYRPQQINSPSVPHVDFSVNSVPKDSMIPTFKQSTQLTPTSNTNNLIRPIQPQLTGLGPQASFHQQFLGQSKPQHHGVQQSLQGHMQPQPPQSLPTSSRIPGYAGARNQYQPQQVNYQGAQVNNGPMLSGSVTQGGRVTPVSIQAQIMPPPQIPNTRPYNNHHVSLPSTFFSSNEGSRIRPNDHFQGQPQNQFQEPMKYIPYLQSGTPTQFKPQSTTPLPRIPHYMKEYLQHHSISNHILARLQNSVRTSRSANLTAEEIDSLLEISKSSPSNEELLKNIEIIRPLLRKLDLEESDEDETDKNSTNSDNHNSEVLANEEPRNETAILDKTLEAVSKINGTTEPEKNGVENISGTTNSTGNATQLEISREPINNGGFRAPNTIQRGFVPILPYSEKDPGPLIMKLGPISNSRNPRALSLPIEYQKKVLISLTRQAPAA